MAHPVGIDPARSFAYSDSVTDLPLLGAVGHPVAVNPDKELRRVAEEHGWPDPRLPSARADADPVGFGRPRSEGET